MDLTDPQQWHGYAYANNNPVTLTDPGGLILCGDEGCNQKAMPRAGGGYSVSGAPVSAVVQTSEDKVRDQHFGEPARGTVRKEFATNAKAPGNGVIVIRGFIPDAWVYGLAEGDNRDFSMSPDASFRVAIAWDTESGELSLTISSSCTTSHYCREPYPIGEKNGLSIVSEDSNGLSVDLTATNPTIPFAPAIDMRFGLTIAGDSITVTIFGDSYPSVEVIQYTEKGPQELARVPHSDPPLVGLFANPHSEPVTFTNGWLENPDIGGDLALLNYMWCQEQPVSPACF